MMVYAFYNEPGWRQEERICNQRLYYEAADMDAATRQAGNNGGFLLSLLSQLTHAPAAMLK